MKDLVKSIIPEAFLKFLRPYYHGVVAFLASWYFGSPSKHMVVIGVTGTAGKSTTVAMLSHILNYANKKSGYCTTINFFDGQKDYINKHGLSMPGGWLLQKQLRQMLANGCTYAIVECTSEGLAQNRHAGIVFNVGLLTNLTPAHLEAHGGFENYKQAKKKLFFAVARSTKQQKMIGVNLDTDIAEEFLNITVAKKFGVTFNAATPILSKQKREHLVVYHAKKSGLGFTLSEQEFMVRLVGDFNLQNAALAAACANMLGVGVGQSAAALKTFIGIRGRMEPVENNRGIQIFVDYGCEPATIRAALTAANQLPHSRLIHVFGTTGGHRDVSKRFDFGRASAELADVSILTNDDVYDSDPQEIIENMQQGMAQVKGNELRVTSSEVVSDRRQAIARALSVAQANDLVLITGKGSEQFLVLPGNKRIPWDDVTVVKEELQKL